MKLVARVAILLVLMSSAYVFAQGPKTCDDLKAEIAKKLDANNVKSYSLDIVAKDKDSDGKVVGSCQAGTMKIVYVRAGAAAATPAAAQKPLPSKK